MQLRQKTDQKKTLYYVEQLLIKYDATKECSAIKPVGGKIFGEFFHPDVRNNPYSMREL